MGPAHKRTNTAATSATTPKMRSLRIMLLSRSKRHKTRNVFAAANTKNINNNNSNNNSNSNSNNKIKIKIKRCNKTSSRSNRVTDEQTKHVNVHQQPQQQQQQEQQQQQQQSSPSQPQIKTPVDSQNKKDSFKLETIDQVEVAEATTTTPPPPTTTTTTTTDKKCNDTDGDIVNLSKRPAQEKVLYDNRIKRKNVLALNEKVAAIREYEKMPVYKRIGRMFHCSPDQIKRIVQQKDIILKAWEQRTRRCQDAKTLEMKVVRVSMLGKAVYDWIRRMMYYKDFMITDGLIQKMALQFKSAMGLQNFFPHQDWCDKFRQTYKITVNDSKLLNIGYTQGHSVQIKDVMKDVLSECTPDLLGDMPTTTTTATATANNEQQTTNHNTSSSCTSKKKLAKQQHMEMERNELKATSSSSSSSSSSSNGSSNSNNADATIKTPLNKPLKLRQLNLPRLLTLPIQRNSSKILVATPLQTAATPMCTNSPMTMTIIPLATISKPLANGLAQTPNRAEPLVAAAEKQQIVPTPILIKHEIKEEVQNNVENTMHDGDEFKTEQTTTRTNDTHVQHIKQEYISEDEDVSIIGETDNDMKVDVQNSTTTNDEIMEDDNLALASLKQIMQKETIKTTATTAVTKTTTTSITTTTTTNDFNSNKKSLPSALVMPTPKRTPTLTLTPIENLRAPRQQPPPMVMSPSGNQQSSHCFWNNGAALSLPSVQHLPPLIKAPVMPSVTSRMDNEYNMMSSMHHHTMLKNQKQNHHHHHHHHHRAAETNNVPLSPIKSCGEARRYLKLLEDFALQSENYRLIGLITRADEVLRELDGDDDVDIG